MLGTDLVTIPLALEKIESLSECLTFLGITRIPGSCRLAYLTTNSYESGTKFQLGYLAKKQSKEIFYLW